MFTVEERDRAREYVLEKAKADPRVVAGAEVGSLALGGGDRWSDLDLTFAVRDDVSIPELLAEWTSDLERVLDAAHLFDLLSGPMLYRVFLLPGLLQVDVSFTPAAEFRPRGPKFRLLFGETGEAVYPQPPSEQELFGLAAHHAIRAWFSIERGRLWQAEYLIGELRNYTLELSCLRFGLPWRYGRGLDELPPELTDAFGETLVRSVERRELCRALERAIEVLVRESEGAGEVATKLAPLLLQLVA